MKPSRGSASSSTGGGAVGIGAGASKAELGSPAPEGKRRSERVKREKPNFYDALEYDNQMRKVIIVWVWSMHLRMYLLDGIHIYQMANIVGA